MSVMPAKQIALFVCQIFFKNFLTIINKLQKKNNTSILSSPIKMIIYLYSDLIAKSPDAFPGQQW